MIDRRWWANDKSLHWNSVTSISIIVSVLSAELMYCCTPKTKLAVTLSFKTKMSNVSVNPLIGMAYRPLWPALMTKWQFPHYHMERFNVTASAAADYHKTAEYRVCAEKLQEATTEVLVLLPSLFLGPQQVLSTATLSPQQNRYLRVPSTSFVALLICLGLAGSLAFLTRYCRLATVFCTHCFRAWVSTQR